MASRVLVGVVFAGGLAISIALVDWIGLVLYVAYAGVGMVLAVRRPANSIGWLLLVAGFGLTFGTAQVTAAPGALRLGDLDPVDAAVAWMNSAGWAFAFVALFALTVVFPSGHLGSDRRLSGFALGLMLAMATLIAVAPTINVSVAPNGMQMVVPNPGALLPEAGAWSVIPTADTLYPTMLVIFAGGLVALFMRYRRSTGRTRLQYRWLVAAIALVVAGTLAWAFLTLSLELNALATIAYVTTYPAVPLAIMVAVLRYRLFEIDRIISRSLAYAIVTATLALVFVGVVLGLQAVLERFVGGNTIAVAASTLIVAALFQPLRRRVQGVVDRRFNRARYDAQRTVEAFSARLRDETDLERLTDGLSSIVGQALEPQTARVWVRRRGSNS